MMISNKYITHLIDQLWDKVKSTGINQGSAIVEQLSFVMLMMRMPGFDKKSSYSISEIEKLFRALLTKYKHESPSFDSLFYNATFVLYDSRILSNSNLYVISEIIELLQQLSREIQKEKPSLEDNTYDVDGIIFDNITHKYYAQPSSGNHLSTPGHISKLMTALIDPKEGETIYDPVCGTGHFLLNAYQHIIARHETHGVNPDEDGFEEITYSPYIQEMYDQPISSRLNGSNDEPERLRLTTLGLILRGITQMHIHNFRFLYDSTDVFSSYDKTTEKFDVILANPPFSGKVDRTKDFRIDSPQIEIQFIDQIPRHLKTGGRASIIVPEGFLTNNTRAYKICRELLLTENRVEAVISLPAGIFAPHTNGKAAVIVFTRQRPTYDSNYKIWFYELETDGYSLDKNRRRLKGNPLTDAIEAFHTRYDIPGNDRTQSAFFVDIQEIETHNWNLTFNRYKENSYERQEFAQTGHLLQEIIRAEREISDELEDLKRMVKW